MYACVKMSYQEESCICSHHLYQIIWNVEVDEFLICERELSNSNDRYAVVVMKDAVVVSHLPKQPSLILSLRNGTNDCISTGGRR